MSSHGVIYIAQQTAMVIHKGKRLIVKSGRTTVREGHDLLKEFGHLFRPLAPDYEVAEQAPEPASLPAPVAEEATAEPNKPRTRGRPKTTGDYAKAYDNVVDEEEEGAS